LINVTVLAPKDLLRYDTGPKKSTLVAFDHAIMEKSKICI
jgi:hypothetical protein